MEGRVGSDRPLCFAVHLQYTGDMKSASIPAVRVEPELRAQVEQVLHEGESLSAFVESAVRDAAKRRLEQSEFIARGLASLAEARRTGQYVSADVAVAKLQKQLDDARRQAQRKSTAGR